MKRGMAGSILMIGVLGVMAVLPSTALGDEAWSAIGLTDKSIYALAVDPITPRTIYAGVPCDGVFKTTNGGETWAEMNTGLTNKCVRTLAIDPKTPATLYAIAYGKPSEVLFKSTNGGASWSNTGPGSLIGFAIAIDPSTPSTLYLATNGGVYKSVNAGESWQYKGIGVSVYSVALDPKTPMTVYAGSYYRKIHKSIDGGDTWQTIHESGVVDKEVIALGVDPVTPTNVYAVSQIYESTIGNYQVEIWKSTDGGVNWANIFYDSYWEVRALAIDPQTPTILYAGAWDGVRKSVDGGVTWGAVNTGLASESVMCLAIDAQTPTTVYAGTYVKYQVGGVYVLGGQGPPPDDTTAPAPPIGLGATPSGWTNSTAFTVSWTNPGDPSGIAAAWYKLGAVPTTATNGTRVAGSSIQALSVAATAQGGQPIHVWLEDGAGNTDHSKRSTVTLKYDAAAPSGGTISINSGAASTSSLLVTLNSLGATETMSTLTHMRFSNNNSTWSAWETYAATRTSWNLSLYGGNANPGAKTVYAQYRDGAGNQSSSSSDAISYSPVTSTLTVSLAGSATGTVTSSPTGISCSPTCSASFPPNTQVTLTPSAGPGGTFSEWRGACTGTAPTCLVTVNAAKSVTAVFSRGAPNRLTAGVTPIKAVDFTELREAINTLRAYYCLPAHPWSKGAPAIGGPVLKEHLADLRNALTNAYTQPLCKAAGRPAPTYAEPTLTAGQTVIKTSHLVELWFLVRLLE